MKSLTHDQVTEPRPPSMWEEALAMRWQITENQEGRSFTWITLGPGVRVTARHAVEGTGAGSRVKLSLDFSGPLGSFVAHLTRRLNARYLALDAQGLRNCAEAAHAKDQRDGGRQ